MSTLKSEMYLVRFTANAAIFSGWNTVYASDLAEARVKFLAKLSREFFDQIDWSTLKVGQAAEELDGELEARYGGLCN